MLLTDWITGRETSEADLARALSCTVSTVNRIRRGVTMPEATLIGRIVEVTGGLVTANDLFTAYQAAHGTADGAAHGGPVSAGKAAA